MSVYHIKGEDFKTMVLEEDKTVLVDFWADWCGPCRMLSPIIEQIAEERPDIKVCKVNVDENPELAMEYHVMSIPMVIAFKKGEVYKKSIGAVPKSAILALVD